MRPGERQHRLAARRRRTGRGRSRRRSGGRRVARDGGRDRAHLVRRDLGAGRVRRRRDQHAARARRPVALDQRRPTAGSWCPARPARRPDRLRARGRSAGCTGTRGPTAGSGRRGRRASAITSSSAADEPAVTMTRSGCDLDAEAVGVVPRDRLPQLGQAQRRRVVDARRRPAPRCAAASTGAGVGKSGSPISMWIDAAAGRLERAGGRLHLHHVEGCDVVERGGGDADGKLRRRSLRPSSTAGKALW